MAAVAPRRVKLAMVGCGIISRDHLAAIIEPGEDQRRFEVTAVVDPLPENRAMVAQSVAELMGISPAQFESLAAAIAADPAAQLFEAVDLMIPSVGSLHEEVALEAMRAGRHILLEKPIAVSLDSAQRIIAAAAELMADDRVFMVAENSEYISEVVEAQELIRAGAIGDVLTARAKYWESCSRALNPDWAACYQPGTFYCTADEGFTFDGA